MSCEHSSSLYRTTVFLGCIAIHQFADTADINVDGTGANATSASNALNSHIILVQIIFQFVHEALAHPVQIGSPGVMPGAVDCEQGEHTAVPIAHPHPRRPVIFILDIETPASGTYKGAGPAVDTGKRDILPKRSFVKFDGIDFL